MRPAKALSVGLLGLAACSTPSALEKAPASGTSPTRAAQADARPKLVVVAIFDQLGSDTLARLTPLLDPHGAIRSGITKGAFYPRVAYPYAATVTAPGHATIHTGAPPSESGILANERYDATHGSIGWMSDPTSPVLDDDSTSASPRALKVPTVADALRAATDNKAHVISLSLKDRAATLGGGKHPDLAVWFDPKLHGFVTSTWYGTKLPGCVSSFEASHPLEKLLAPWTPENPKALATLGPDDRPGEGHYHGWGTTFPHDPRASEAPWSVLRTTPALDQYLVQMSGQCADQLALGAHDDPDLLVISISGTDYAGHVFGPRSWEYADTFIRADHELGRLLHRLSKHIKVAALMTADHGVTQVAEQLQARGRSAGRIEPQDLVKTLDAQVTAKLGPGPWVTSYVMPFVRLTDKGRAERDQVVSTLVAGAHDVPGIYGLYDVRRASELRRSTNRVDRAVGLGINLSVVPGELFVVPEPGWIVAPDNVVAGGTSHGSPWQSDREVPVVMWGTSVVHATHKSVADMRQVAPTVAALLGVPKPSGAKLTALPGAVMGR